MMEHNCLIGLSLTRLQIKVKIDCHVYCYQFEDQMQLMLFTCFKLAKLSDILGKQSIS